MLFRSEKNKFSPEDANKIIQAVERRNNMSSYDYLTQEATKAGLALGIEQGIEKGIEKGREEGVSIKEKDFATSLIISTDFDDEKIAILVSVTVEYVSNLRTELGK